MEAIPAGQAPTGALAPNPFGDALAVKVSRVAEVLDCSSSQVYALVKAGRLERVEGFGNGKRAGIRITVASIYRMLGGELDIAPGPTPAVRAANGKAKGQRPAWMRG